jgi:phenylalanyl-tRNA synthetase beta chain
MGLGFEEGRIKETHYAIVPPYRVDFLHQIDVVEDIAIAYGYNSIHAELPQVSTVAKESAEARFAALLRKTLVGYGLLEAKTYHLLGSRYQQELGHKDLVMLKSSVSEEYDALRASLLASLLQALTHNRLHEYPQGLFEIGTVFAPGKDEVAEGERLCVALAGEADYTRIRQAVDGVLLALGIAAEAAFSPAKDPMFLEGRCASLTMHGRALGTLGELSPRLLDVAQLKVPVAACELDVRALREIALR